MSDIDIGRIQRDLDTIRKAVEQPSIVSKEHVWHNLGIAAIGVVLACATKWSGVATLVDGGPNLWYVGLVLGAAAAVLVGLVVIARIRKEETPSFFAYSVKAAVAAALSAAVFFVFAVWAVRTGFSLGTLAVAAVFFAGVFQLVSATTEGWNPLKFGWGVTFLCMAFVLPFGHYETAGILAGVILTLGGLLTSLLVGLQLRRAGQ